MSTRRALLLTTVLLVVFAFAASLFAQSDSVRTYLIDGGRKMADQDYKGAREAYQKVLQLDPNNFEAVKTLGAIASALGDPRQARVYLERAYRMNPLDADLCNNLGALLSMDNKPAEAIKYYEMAAKLDTVDALILSNLGMEYLKVGQIDKARTSLFRAAKLDTINPIIPFSIGNCYSAEKNFDSSEYYYDRSVASGGTDPQLFYFRGITKRNLGKTAEAEKDFKEALRRNPKYIECYQSLGLLYVTQMKYPEAAEQFEQVVKLNPKFIPGVISLGVMYALINKQPDADNIRAKLYGIDSSYGAKMDDLVEVERSRTKKK
jgi:Tfp pilus assembly protein PilF